MKARFADRRSVPRPSVVGLDTGDSHEDRPTDPACFMRIPFPETLSIEDGTLGESWASGVRTDQIIEVSESRIVI